MANSSKLLIRKSVELFDFGLGFLLSFSHKPRRLAVLKSAAFPPPLFLFGRRCKTGRENEEEEQQVAVAVVQVSRRR
ncbi:hypothetical protein Syun_022891 [Stephania yunnanensis]|uniref:Uncharacterized protein n=1 Tax=Stephania yunnanensis TaxID=152371 RepID=A0AAP0FAB1_9MAGN